MTPPDVWLRGRVPEVPALLQPVAHALLQAQEDVETVGARLTPEALWVGPGTAATPGFHLKHIAGSTDRLFTYARGETLSDIQRAWLADEATASSATATVDGLVREVQRVVDASIDQLRKTPIEFLTTQRLIGREQLATTVLGCLYHAGEHAARHAGQLVTTVRAQVTG